MISERLVVIYGAGNYGLTLLKMLNEMNFFVDFFVQTEVKGPKKLKA